MKYLTFLAFFATVAVSLSSAQLDLLPPSTNSSISPEYTNALVSWIHQVLNVLGVNSILDGPPNTNQQGPLQGPLRAIQPTSAEARHYIKLAGSAYCPRTLETWTCEWCLPGYTYKGKLMDLKYNTMVYFAVNQQRKEILVSWRGSTNVPNFALDFVPVPTPVTASENTNPLFGNYTLKDDGILLHLGFKLMTDSLYPQAILKLKTLMSQYPSDYKIVVTGHSLGAAEASLTVFYLYHSQSEPTILRRNIELYTYGLPRAGNRQFADFMNNLPIKIARVVERADIAPRIAPAALGYYHFQHEIWVHDILGNGTDRTNCSTEVYEDPTCSASLGPLYTIVDHFTYYDVDLLLCYLVQDPILVLLDFILPFREFIPKELLDVIPILPAHEGGLVAELLRTLTLFLG